MFLLLLAVAWPASEAAARRHRGGRNRGQQGWNAPRQLPGRQPARFSTLGRGQFAPTLGKLNLRGLGRSLMEQNGFRTGIAPKVEAELARIQGPASPNQPGIRDERSLGWFSIDNPDSTDLDQLSFAERLPNNNIRLKVAIADVDALVPKGSELDQHSVQNMTSVYLPGKTHHLRPDKILQLASLNPDQDRLAVVVEMLIAPDGRVVGRDIYRAQVRNRTRTNYEDLTPWLEGHTKTLPTTVAAAPGFAENLRLHDEVATRLRSLRQRAGHLRFADHEVRAAVNQAGEVTALTPRTNGRANDIIEEVMIAANTTMTGFLSERGFSVIERVNELPLRWEGIRALAARNGHKLPASADRLALQRFLDQLSTSSPERFKAVSPALIRMLKRSEFRLLAPGATPTSHWTMGAILYGQGTAPLRRELDAVGQRRLKAALLGQPDPYSGSELIQLIDRANANERLADEMERRVGKSAAASFLQGRVGDTFDAVVTNVNQGRVFVSLMNEHAEGLLHSGANSLQPGDRVRVRLTAVDPERGFLDFARSR